MDCTQAQLMMNAALAPGEVATTGGELLANSSQHANWEAHAAQCPRCAQHWADLRWLDAELRAAMSPHRGAAVKLAGRVASALTPPELTPPEMASPESTSSKIGNPTVAPRPGKKRDFISGFGTSHLFTLPSWLAPFASRQFASRLATLAAGFLLAVLVVRPWQRPASPSPEVPSPNGVAVNGQSTTASPAAPKPVARLVLATGDVSIRSAADADWSAVPSSSALDCRPGATLRTEPGVRCEVQTADGCVIRVNDDSQITIRSARSIELHQGQVWCSAPEDVPMEVVAPAAVDASPSERASPAPSWTFHCQPHASLISSFGKKEGVRLTAARGEVEVRAGDTRRRLPHGQSVTLRDGQFADLSHHGEALLAATWIDSLLVRKGHADPELLSRVDDLLAQIGQAKASHLYEQELRALGEHGVLPLLRYVQSPLSSDDQGQRHRAMRIAADLSPAWAVGELIPLLDDPDEDVRFSAAAALRRLTGESHGREPPAWRSPRQECSPTLASWQNWWQTNRQRYPHPDFAKSVPLPGHKRTKKS